MKPLERLQKLNTNDCLWIYVLSILKEKPFHAYAIRGEIEKRFGFRPGNVTSYKVLYLLTKSGYTTKKKDDRRVVYTITESGKKELRKASNFYKQLIKNI